MEIVLTFVETVQSYNNRISKQEVISYGIYVKSDYTNLTTSQYIHYLYWL